MKMSGRKIAAMLLVACMLWGLAACGADEPSPSSAPTESTLPTTAHSATLPGTSSVVSTTTSGRTASKTDGAPYIGENGNWWIGGKDTGIKATTAPTATTTTNRTHTPGGYPVTTTTMSECYIGENGNWFIGGIDTGVKATSATQSTTTVTTTTTTTTTTAAKPTDREYPYTGNAAILYSKKTSAYDTVAEERRQEILGVASAVRASTSGTTYYVSYNGNDNNNGKSPSTAWRTTDAVARNRSKLRSGDVVLFERGGVYRGTMYLVSGVSFGAYGTGSKPCLYGSPKNYADASLWQQSGKNIWRLNAGTSMGDVGNIVFDHGKVCASIYRICDSSKFSTANLKSNYQYFHDTNSGYLYMYYDGGNPGAKHTDIELCFKKCIISSYNGTILEKNITIDNLCLKYTGAHAIAIGKAQNVNVTNCEIGYIGGSLMSLNGSSVRYGNGIEYYSHVTNALVENNWIYQCYDAGYTNQGQNAKHVGITVRRNLIEYCNYNIEYFCGSSGQLKNIVYENNILRFAGYGFGTKNRYGSDTSAVSNINGWRQEWPTQNFVIRNNILDVSYRYLVVTAYVGDGKGPTFSGNRWNQYKSAPSAVALMLDQPKNGWDGTKYTLWVSNLTTMKNSVAVLDPSPAAVTVQN